MQSVERMSQILAVLGRTDCESLGVSDIARQLDLPKSLVFRMLTSLTESGLVHKADDARYTLGSLSLELGVAALKRRDITDACLPWMQRLSDETEETVTLSLLLGHERTYRAQIQSVQDVRKTVRIGARYPLYAGNAGRAMLAYFSDEELARYLDSVELKRLTEMTLCDHEALMQSLKEVRRCGFAVSHGERDQWSAGVGAPIFDVHEQVIAAISICAPIARLSAEICVPYGEKVKTAARHITREIGGRMPPLEDIDTNTLMHQT